VAVSKFPIEAGAILLFARAVGDTNPIYADADYAAKTEIGSIIAPPTFIQSGAQFDPDYPLRPKPGQPWFGSGRNPTGIPPTPGSGNAMAAGLHAEQEFTYHRHLRPGDVLSASSRPGEQWERQGRSGKLVFSSSFTDYRDQNGELVITAKSVGVRTERPASGEGE
jgi:N-terminal half of MaoC dehydratase